ncbi:FAD-dependent monooxygenase [Physcia stellaris]|nr:FAD-dependent monooxygenase [Physcia stellaris]
MNPQEIEQRARRLCQHLVDGIAQSNLGSTTPAIYDTAWLSMVAKPDGESAVWLFPDSFQYLLNQQLPSGGWEAYATKEDGILNSLAALLALKRHQASSSPSDLLLEPIQRATMFLRNSLQTLDVDDCLNVGFEILVPALLELLGEEDIHLSFPGRETLVVLGREKMELFSPDLLYGSAETTLFHSLEALTGKIDFSQIQHRKTFGSMMGSPASTAAYLINNPEWDDEAESYLRTVILEGTGKGTGACPSAFPTPIFEISWIISLLLQGGFSGESLGQQNLGIIGSYLEQQYLAHHGLIGFAPSIQADADDSAKVLLTLNLLGHKHSAKSLTEHFRSDDGHFYTYTGERNSSVSANCNVLRALLETPDPKSYMADVVSILGYLCESWWNDCIKDKWNISPQYSMMLLAETLVRLLEAWDQCLIDQLPDSLLQDRVPILLIQILNRTMTYLGNNSERGLDQHREVISYAVLTLKAVSTLPWLGDLKESVLSCIEEWQSFLRERRTSWEKPQYLETAKIVHIFSKLQCFQSAPDWEIGAAVLEGSFFLPQLRASQASLLGGELSAKNEYISFIPCTWVVVNTMQKLFLDTHVLWDMMVLSLRNFRVDEYMETTIARLSEPELREAIAVVRTLCQLWNAEEYPSDALSTQTFSDTNASNVAESEASSSSSAPISRSSSDKTAPTASPSLPIVTRIHLSLSHYVQSILNNPSIDKASQQSRIALRTALQTFLISHIDQTLYNKHCSAKRQASVLDCTQAQPQVHASSSFADWLHKIAGPSVSASFSFTFLTCLKGGFRSPTARYMATDFGERVGLMSRLYNDLGSVARDRAEENLNCVDFAEVHNYQATEAAKTRLKEMAQYERDAARWVGLRLIGELQADEGKDKARKADTVRLFLGVAELYADIYVLRDLSNRLDGGK